MDDVIGDLDSLIRHMAVIVSCGDVYSDATDEGGINVTVVGVVSIDLYLSVPTHKVSHLETVRTYRQRLSLNNIYQGFCVMSCEERSII